MVSSEWNPKGKQQQYHLPVLLLAQTLIAEGCGNTLWAGGMMLSTVVSSTSGAFAIFFWGGGEE